MIAGERDAGDERDGYVADLYDTNPAYSGRTDVAFYVDMARESGGPVLELGCGTGRVLIPVARAGIDIVGLDRSEAMLARCREKVACEPANVRDRIAVVAGDMASFDLGRKFALVTMPFRPFQHLVEVDEQIACLRCANRHLAPGGRIIIDVYNPKLEFLVREMPGAEVEDVPEQALPDGRRFRRAARNAANHRAAQVNDVEIIYYVTDAAGRTERSVWAFPMRYFFRYELEHLAARCGFRVAAVYGNYDRAPFSDASPEIVLVTEKIEGASP